MLGYALKKWKNTLLKWISSKLFDFTQEQIYFLTYKFSYQQMETILIYSWQHFLAEKSILSHLFMFLYVFPWTIILHSFRSILFRLHFSLVSWLYCRVSHKGIRSWWNIYNFPRKTYNKYICQTLYLMCSKEMVSSSVFIYPKIYSQFTLTVKPCYPQGVLLYIF